MKTLLATSALIASVAVLPAPAGAAQDGCTANPECLVEVVLGPPTAADRAAKQRTAAKKRVAKARAASYVGRRR